jgi:hypothetical protein
MVTPNNYSIAVTVPPVMPSAVMSVELGTRTAIVMIAIVIVGAAA